MAPANIEPGHETLPSHSKATDWLNHAGKLVANDCNIEIKQLSSQAEMVLISTKQV
jgi:hypothetical protein